MHACDDDKGVIENHIAAHGVIEWQYTNTEVVSVQTQIGHVHSVLVGIAIVLMHCEVQGLCCQFGVELAGFAIESWASVIVYAIGDVGGLLHLCQ